jgi:hypothetical protein
VVIVAAVARDPTASIGAGSSVLAAEERKAA